MAKVPCIVCHRGVQLILAYSWAKPAILIAGKGRGGMFLFLQFLHFQSCSSLSLSFISSTISFFLPFSWRWYKITHKGWRVVSLNLNTINSPPKHSAVGTRKKYLREVQMTITHNTGASRYLELAYLEGTTYVEVIFHSQTVSLYFIAIRPRLCRTRLTWRLCYFEVIFYSW